MTAVAAAIAFARERLPFVVAPLPGEAMDSWIEHYARELIMTSRDFLTFLGLPAAQPARMTVMLTETEQAVLATRTGLEPDRLRAMTLEPWDTVAVTIRHQTRGLASPPHWRRHKGSRYCPHCLRESGGRWHLAWRTPWAFACPLHHALLAETCPTCGLRPLPAGRSSAPPTTASHCTHLLPPSRRHAKDGRPCHTDLTGVATTALEPGSPILGAQNGLDALLARAATSPEQAASVRAELAETFFLGWRCLSATSNQPTQLPAAVTATLAQAGGPPHALTGLSNENARDVAIAATLAAMVRNQSHPASDTLLTWIARDHRTASATDLGASLQPWQQACTPPVVSRALRAIDAMIRGIDRLRYGSASPTPRPPDIASERIARRAAAVPTVLWPSWSMRLLPHATGGPRGIKGSAFRAALSALLLIPRAPQHRYNDALELLGNPVSGRLLAHLVTSSRPEHLTAIISALTQLADALDQHDVPIDYHRRRTLARRDDLLVDRRAYQHLAARHHWRRLDPGRTALDDYLRALLTTNPLPNATAGPRQRKDHALQQSGLRLRAHPELRAFVHEQATGHLRRLGIDEPLLWEPPAHWVTGVHWPGTDPADVDHRAFARHAARHTTMSELAKATGLGAEHTRLYAEITGTTMHKAPPPGTDRRPYSIVPPPEILLDLYETHRPSLRQLAKVTGCGTEALKAALRAAGIHLPPTAPRPPIDFDRDWLYEQYILARRPARELAREKGVHPATIVQRARTWSLPSRNQLHPPQQFTTATAGMGLPPTLCRAFLGHGSIERLRNLTALLHHPTISAAARACGAQPGTLRAQIKVVERHTGRRLATTNPHTLTKEGQALLRRAEQIITLLDSHGSA